MTLYERGLFKLDDPVSKYLPAFETTTVLGTNGDSDKSIPPQRPITVRDVFRHTTGYSYGGEPSVFKSYEKEGLRYWGPADMFPPKMTVARAANALARVPALHHPGERFTYGYSTDLLGRLIEVWSGKPLDQYLQQAVFGPLEMVDAGFSIPQEKRVRFASCRMEERSSWTRPRPAHSMTVLSSCRAVGDWFRRFRTFPTSVKCWLMKAGSGGGRSSSKTRSS